MSLTNIRFAPANYEQKDKIIKYYLLCSVRLGERKHIVNEIPEKKLTALLTQREINLYLRKQNGYYVARETTVGGRGGAETQQHVGSVQYL